MKAKYVFFFLLIGSAPVRAEQVCDTRNFPLSLHAEQYKDNGDGTLTDDQSKLTWMRCSLGQTWTGKTCTGTPGTYAWQAAQDAAAGLDRQGGYAGRSDWRVPQIPELAMIVERQCSNPRTNITLFPETPAHYYWTSTVPADPGNAYALSFGDEGARFMGRGEALFVRLVSGGKPK
jgi:hypothetical protein